jgi:hypothetical protein
MRRLTVGWALTLSLLLFGGGCAEITIPTPGLGCDSDGDCNEAGSCRVAACVDGMCSYSLQSGFCFVDGQCFNEGQSAPGDACKLCNPKLNATTYVNKVCETGLCNPKTGACDGGEPDTFTPEDVSSPEDTTPVDTTPVDTAPVDTAPEDTAQEDTTPVDTTSEDTAPEDTMPKDVAPEDATPEDTNPVDTTPPAPAVTCNTYCTNVTMACQGGLKQYDTKEDCIVFCKGNTAAMPVGSENDTAVNSRSCRNYHALVALEEPAVHCAHAGPLGGGVCGPYCGTYCDFASANCFGVNQIYDDYVDCTQTCQGFEKSGSIFDLSGDTLQCRFQFLTEAWADPGNACPNAAKDGGVACVCMPSCPIEGCGADNGCGEPCGCAKGEECINGSCIGEGVIVGDTCAAPIAINQLPFVDTNNTGSFTHKYLACLQGVPEAGIPNPDVVYAYTAKGVIPLEISIKSPLGTQPTKATLLSWDVSCPMWEDSCQTQDFYESPIPKESVTFCTEKGTTYYFIVDSISPMEVGPYQLHVQQGLKLCGGGIDK